MKSYLILRHVMMAACLLSFSIGASLLAQTPVSVRTPGSAFIAESPNVIVNDVAGGRSFRGRSDALVKLRAVMRIPPATAADPKMLRLVIYFRTSAGGPSLRSVEVLNGGAATFSIETMLSGDYTTAEVTTEGGNAWDLKRSPRTVSAQSIIRVSVRFPIGVDSRSNPGEFVLNSVRVDFPPKEPQFNEPAPSLPPMLPASSAAVIYAVAENNDLLWYRHDGRADGSSRWAQPKKIGDGWGFKQVFSGGAGVIYAITADGDLLWYRHDGYADGTVRWTDPKKVGNGWNFKEVFYGGGGVIYAINDNGDLLWYRHDGHTDGSMRWSQPRQVGNGWNFKEVFYGGDGVIYAINDNGDLLWYRHDGHADGSMRWTQPRQVGNGWGFKKVFYGGGGVIYAIKSNGDLLWYRHDGHADGSYRWSQPKQVGNGWNFKEVFVDEPGS